MRRPYSYSLTNSPNGTTGKLFISFSRAEKLQPFVQREKVLPGGPTAHFLPPRTRVAPRKTVRNNSLPCYQAFCPREERYKGGKRLHILMPAVVVGRGVCAEIHRGLLEESGQLRLMSVGREGPRGAFVRTWCHCLLQVTGPCRISDDIYHRLSTQRIGFIGF